MQQAELQIIGKGLRLHKARQEPPHIDVSSKEECLFVELVLKTRPSRSRAGSSFTTFTSYTTTIATDMSDDAWVLGGEAIPVTGHALHPKGQECL
jgi:hypothetical protein